MRAGFQTALNAIYPGRCLSCGGIVDSNLGLCGACWRNTAFIGGTICDACGTPLPGAGAGGDADLRCDECIKTPRPWVRGRAALLYRDQGRKMVLALKHGDRQEIAQPAALWMAQALGDLVQEKTLIAPVPLHWTRMMMRRYNQSALLSQSLSTQLDRAHCPDLLQRVRATCSLDGLNRTERAQMMQGAIRVHPKRRHRLAGRPVLLVDDVMTSGATLGAATQACQQAGSGPVCVVTLARVAKDT